MLRRAPCSPVFTKEIAQGDRGLGGCGLGEGKTLRLMPTATDCMVIVLINWLVSLSSAAELKPRFEPWFVQAYGGCCL